MGKGKERPEENGETQVATALESRSSPYEVPEEIFNYLIERIPPEEIVDKVEDCEIEIYAWLDPRTRGDFRHHVHCKGAVIFRAGSLGEVLVLNGNHRAIWGRGPKGKFSGGTNLNEERLYKRGGDQNSFVLYTFLPPKERSPGPGELGKDEEYLDPRARRIKEGIRQALHTDEVLGRSGATQEERNLAFRIGENSGFVASLSFSHSPREMVPSEKIIELRTRIAVALQLLE